jgi:hypothetical protein
MAQVPREGANVAARKVGEEPRGDRVNTYGVQGKRRVRAGAAVQIVKERQLEAGVVNHGRNAAVGRERRVRCDVVVERPPGRGFVDRVRDAGLAPARQFANRS